MIRAMRRMSTISPSAIPADLVAARDRCDHYDHNGI
jgi:hypothetical protein